jgi:cysteine desulfurase/selenocysteine lyase
MNEVSPIVAAPSELFDVRKVREDFPALHQDVHGKPLVYLDSAATTLKPQSVIDAVDEVYARDCANIHRAVHLLSQRATARYEEAREKVRTFLNASKTTEIAGGAARSERATRFWSPSSNTTRTSYLGKSSASRLAPSWWWCR